MKTVMRSCRKVFWTAPLLLALLLAGCMGRNSWLFPSPQTEESTLEHVTTATFEERVLKCDKTVLVDFYATRCGPCKMLAPLLEEFAKEHPDVRVVKVNVDENHDLVLRYRVQAMPTVLVIRGGQETTRSVGLVTKEKIKEMAEYGVR